MRNTKVKLIVSLLIVAVVLGVGASAVLRFVSKAPEKEIETVTDHGQNGTEPSTVNPIPTPEESASTEPTIPPVSDHEPDDTVTEETPTEPEETPTTPPVPDEDVTLPPSTETPDPATKGEGELDLNVGDKRDENSNRAPAVEGEVTITPETKEVEE